MRKFYDTDYGGGYSSIEIPENIVVNPSIGELYQNVLNHFGGGGGICRNIDIYTPISQIDNLYEHFKKQKPNIFSKFYWNKTYTGRTFWWTFDKDGKEQRKLFLAYLAKKYKNKYFKS